jgi:hypothetical protein
MENHDRLPAGATTGGFIKGSDILQTLNIKRNRFGTGIFLTELEDI